MCTPSAASQVGQQGRASSVSPGFPQSLTHDSWPAYTPGSSHWKTSIGTNDIATDLVKDGKVNEGQVANSTTFPAFKLCKDLTDGGYTDWYFPSRNELDMLWRNRAAVGGFAATNYWSSSETDTGNALNVNFNSSFGSASSLSKVNGFDVRCIRRD